MRAIIQRVTSASVDVEGATVSSIGKGMLVLVGIGQSDSETDAEWIVKKLLGIRLWTNQETGKGWDLSVQQLGGEILCVSQFTLFGRLKGNKPDYSKAMAPQDARALYDKFLQRLRAAYQSDRIKDGVFGAMMDVKLCNDGPVTFTLDSQDKSNIM